MRVSRRMQGCARAALLIVMLAGGLVWGCARGVVRPEAFEAREIDLSPRCSEELVDEGIARERAWQTSTSREVAAPARQTGAGLPRDVRWLFDPTPRSGLASLAWGFALPPSAISSGAEADPALAAALLRAGETTAAPARFRSELLALGAQATTTVLGGWLWLEMRFPESTLEEAVPLFLRWLEPHPARPDAFESIARQVALTRLAEESAPGALAEEVFRRAHPAPPGGLRVTEWGGPERASTPERIQRLLESALRPEGSVVIASGASGAARLRDEIAAGLSGDAFAAAPALAAPEAPIAREGSPSRATPATAETARRREPAIYVVDRPGSPQVEILAGYPTLAELGPEREALEMLASLLGGNVGGRLFRDLRERQGLAYIINAEQSLEGRFVVRTRARPERVAALLQGIEAHLRALVELPLQACELEMLVGRRLGEEALLASDPVASRRRAQSDVALHGAPRTASSERDRIFRAAELGLDEVARRHLSGPPTVVLVGEADGLLRDLERFFPDRAVRVLASDLADLAPARPAAR